jgi:4-amino-4-deoxy-L-arabinose transferase-like glycosyltransferase
MQSIVTTGVDIDGTLQPFLYSPLERHPPIYNVAAYASTRILGNTPLGWRFPAAAFGVLSIALLYLVVLELTRRRTIALIAALLFAIEPVQVHFSRIGWPPASVLPFLLAALWLLLRALREARPDLSFPRLAAAAVLIGLCPYTYAASWFYTLILTGSLVALNARIFRRPANRPKLLAAATIALAIAGPGLLIEFTDPHTALRVTSMSTFANGINGSSIGVFFNHYFSHFGWPYLFATGASDAHYLSGYGAMYWWYGPLMIAGALYGHRYLRSRALEAWLWIWLLVYPLGGALTNDGGAVHPARTLAGSPSLCIFAAIGAYALLVNVGALIESRPWRRRYRLGLVTALALCAIGSVWSFANWYFTVYPVLSAEAWESGTREAFASVRAHEAGYRRVCLLGFNPWHVGTLRRYFLSGTPLTVFEDGSAPACTLPSTLVLTTQPLLPIGLTSLATIYGADGKPFARLGARPLTDNGAPLIPSAAEGLPQPR